MEGGHRDKAAALGDAHRLFAGRLEVVAVLDQRLASSARIAAFFSVELPRGT